MIKYSKIVISILCLLGFTSFLSAQAVNDGSRYAANSVLANGKWIQLKVKETGIYKLTYDDIKKQGIDPAKVKIYGYGGWILPEDFTQPYIDDLPEVSVYINKGSDGVFSSGDYLLFYGRGTTKWTYNRSSNTYQHQNNPYSTYGSYFMTESDTGPKEMDTIPLSTGLSNPVPLNVFDDYAVHEKDSISILNSGRELFGENFVVNGGKQSFTFTIPGITADAGKVRLSFAASPSVVTPVKLSIDNQDILSLSVNAPNDTYVKAYLAEGWGNWTGTKNENVTATVSYNSTGQSVAYLNFIVLNMKRTLQFYPVGYTFFRNSQSLSSPVTYSIGNPTASCQIWDVTQNNNTQLIETTSQDGQMQFTTPASNTLREFVMVDPGKSFPTPVFAGTVANQNLHALPSTDMVIIAPTVYLSQAQALANKHQQQSGLRVAVVEEKTVFNEFSSGTPDATAYRRFMKMFYDRAISNADKPKYLLLYGGGLFDNRHLTSTGSKLDPKYYLLTYQVGESLNENTSYGTDDYFGFLDDNEGVNIAYDGLDIGVGRFPVSSVPQATDVLNKVTSYMDNKQYGSWKTQLIFTADNTDEYPSGYTVHATQADSISQYIAQNYPEYILYKYYVDAYKLVSVNGKKVAPDAKKDLLNRLNDGCFLLNYIGHGSTTSWSAEDLLNIADVRQMKFKNLPLWITATCDFGWFDGFDASGGETAFLNKTSGAIALFTTSRVVQSPDNASLNYKFIRNMFAKNGGKYLCLGDIMKLSKIQLGSNANKLNYVLLGDPALTLNYPQWNIRLDSINGNPISDDETYTWKALDKVTVSGVITDDSGAPANNFSGTLNANIFDSQQTMQSLSGTDKDGKPFTYTDYPNMIYSGNTTVTNGAFSLSFNVPLDISYSADNGKIGMYAYDATQGIDAAGSFMRYNLFGTGDNSDTTGAGPTITAMYLNTENFRNGDKVNETPFFYAQVADDNGINLAGGDRGHDITIIIDNNPKWTYSLNNYYQATDITQGNVGFSIPELPAGNHTLLFRVWNILNNSSTDTLNFTVVKGFKPTILDLDAYGNPARTNTYFVFTNNLPGTTLNVEIGVYDITGRAVWIYNETGSAGFLQQHQIQWDLVSSAGNRVPPGIYIYRATIRTTTSTTTTKAKKIIVLGQ